MSNTRIAVACAALAVGQALVISGLAVSSHVVRRAVILPIATSLLLYAAFVGALAPKTPHNRIRINCLALNALLRAFDLLLCSKDPQTKFVFDEDAKDEKKQPVAQRSFSSRFKWAFHLFFSLRGGGWNWRVAGTPPSRPSSPKAWFVGEALVRLFASYFMLEGFEYVVRLRGAENTLQAPWVLMYGILIYTSLDVPYQLGSIIWVVTGIGNMDECPPLYGSVLEANTVARFWGKYWHQCFRRPFSVMTGALFGLFGWVPDRETSVIFTFLISGLYHASISWAMSVGTYYFRTFLFFAVQPIAIMLEHSELFSVSRRHSWIGYIWVCTWFSLTAGLFFYDWVYCGFFDNAGAVIEVPVFGPLIEGTWETLRG